MNVYQPVQIPVSEPENDAEMLLKSFWISHLQMMNGLEPISRIELVDEREDQKV